MFPKSKKIKVKQDPSQRDLLSVWGHGERTSPIASSSVAEPPAEAGPVPEPLTAADSDTCVVTESETTRPPASQAAPAASESQSVTKQRNFQSRWLKLYPWLCYSAAENKMWCRLCRDAKKTNSMAVGITTNFRTSTLARHVMHSQHLLASSAADERKNFEAATAKALTKEESGVVVALKAVYWLAKECIPLRKYCSLIKFLKTLKVPDIEHLNINQKTDYSSYNTAVDLATAMSMVIDDAINESIKSSPVLTIMCDESTDIVVHHKLVINCRIVDPLTLEPKTIFLTDMRLTEATGKGIHSGIKSHLESRGVNISRTSALGTDGATTMTGRKEGLLGHFLRDNPHIMNTHCGAHRLALCTSQAAPGIPAIKEFAGNIEKIYYHFKRSPHKVDMMEGIQKVLNDPVLKYR